MFSKRTPEELIKEISGLMWIAAEPIVNRHRASWLEVSIRVREIEGRGSEVVVKNTTSYTRPVLVLSFDKRAWCNKLKILDQGDRISAVGRIADISSHVLCLEDCELVEEAAAAGGPQI